GCFVGRRHPPPTAAAGSTRGYSRARATRAPGHPQELDGRPRGKLNHEGGLPRTQIDHEEKQVSSWLVSLALLRRFCSWRSLPRVEVVPIQDRVEAERVGALRLPAPERTNREHHHVSLA